MNILIATVYSEGGGGLSSHMADLMRCLKQRGHEVLRIGYEQIKLSMFQTACGVLRSLGNKDACRMKFAEGRLANLTRKIDAACKAERFDLIHCHDPFAGYAVRMGAHSAKLPLIQTIPTISTKRMSFSHPSLYATIGSNKTNIEFFKVRG